MKKLSFVALFLLIATSTTVYFEVRDKTTVKRFRSSQDPWIQSRKDDFTPSLIGFRELHMSGSSSVALESLSEKLQEATKREIYIVDLQQESHVFIDYKPAHWYGYEYGQPLSQSLESVSLKHKLRRLIHSGRLTHQESDQDVLTEAEVLKKYNLQYRDFSATRKRVPGSDNVDLFIENALRLPQEGWKHFHCAAGQGRTTVFMVMFDILHNAKEVPLKDITWRNYLVGGEDLLDVTVWKTGSYSKDMLEGRRHFIQKFYEYIKSEDGYQKHSWIEWNKIYYPQTANQSTNF